MQQSLGQRPTMSVAVIGMLLIAVGIVALALRDIVGLNFSEAMDAGAWPFLVIVPGLVLLGAAVLPAPPRGIPFAIAGAVVTTLGGLLLYQSQSGHWESWAYAWALLPLSAGVAMIVYGLLTGARDLVRTGLWLGSIAAVVFVAGAWFFEGVFAGEPRPADIGDWWPVGVIAIGAVLVVRAVLFQGRSVAPPADGSKPI